jgi:SAM-dependent methyltransferase
MHDTASKCGNAFAEAYGNPGYSVIDVGGRDVNGSLRSFFTNRGMKYISVDIEAHSSVDIVVQPGEKLPFEDGSIDLVVSTSCFEHDPCFWMTFKELTRIIKPTGAIYVNAPTNGIYHAYPADSWRFYSDAGQSLAYWSGKQLGNEPIFPVRVEESFNVLPPPYDPDGCYWNDFVCVWTRVPEENKETEITTPNRVLETIGILEETARRYGLSTRKKC